MHAALAGCCDKHKPQQTENTCSFDTLGAGSTGSDTFEVASTHSTTSALTGLRAHSPIPHRKPNQQQHPARFASNHARMGRVTRKKAAEIAEQLHVDEDAVLDMNTDEAAVKANLAAPQHSDRSPLGELEPNSAESENPEEDPVEEFRKSTRSRKAGKKGTAKGKKNDLAAGVATLPEQAETVPDYNDAAPSPASEKAAEELISPEPECESISSIKRHPGKLDSANAGMRLSGSRNLKRARRIAKPTQRRGSTDKESTGEKG